MNDIAKQIDAELKRRQRELQRKARVKILGFLAGTISAALNEEVDHSWIFKDVNGDKLKTPEEKNAARLEAHRILRNLEEERELLKEV